MFRISFQSNSKVETLIAAISFQDTLAYTLYNGKAADAPDIENEYPQVKMSSDKDESEGGIITPSMILSDPKNKTWITSTPSLKSNMMNALSVAIRSYVDEAVSQKDATSNESDNSCSDDKDKEVKSYMKYLDTARDVLNGTCLSSSISLPNTSYQMLEKALHVAANVVESLDSQEESDCQTETQVQNNAFNVLKSVIQHPLSLFHGGSTHFLVYKCAIFTAHHVNKLQKESLREKSTKENFEEALDLYNSIRVILTLHNAKLPHCLRLPVLPRSKLNASKKSSTVINLEDVAAVHESEKMSTAEKKPGDYNSASLDIEKECNINDKSFLVFLSGCF